MAKPLREQIEGGTYHVMNRGNRKAPIFEDDYDRLRFLQILDETRQDYDVEVLANCPMGNHFHLIVVTPQGNISAFMEQFEGQYAQYSNRRHKRVGHVFQGRFKAVLIENDVHLLAAVSYVFMNPVAAGFVDRPEQWRWSTFAATVGLKPLPDYISIDWLEALFPGLPLAAAQRRLRELLRDAKPVRRYLEWGKYFGDPGVVREIVRSYIGERRYEGSIPREYRDALRPSLDEIFVIGMTKPQRNAAIYRAHAEYGYALSEISMILGLHPTSASRIFCSFRRKPKMPKSGPAPKISITGAIGRGRGRRRESSRRRRRRSRG